MHTFEFAHSYSVKPSLSMSQTKIIRGVSQQILTAVGHYRDRGYKIAIDDFGGRTTHLDGLWKYQLDFIKFDVSLIPRQKTITVK